MAVCWRWCCDRIGVGFGWVFRRLNSDWSQEPAARLVCRDRFGQRHQPRRRPPAAWSPPHTFITHHSPPSLSTRSSPSLLVQPTPHPLLINHSSTAALTLLTPTRSPGLSAAASTRPTTGRKTVWRVDVLSTTHLPVVFRRRWVACLVVDVVRC